MKFVEVRTFLLMTHKNSQYFTSILSFLESKTKKSGVYEERKKETAQCHVRTVRKLSQPFPLN